MNQIDEALEALRNLSWAARKGPIHMKEAARLQWTVERTLDRQRWRDVGAELPTEEGEYEVIDRFGDLDKDRWIGRKWYSGERNKYWRHIDLPDGEKS